MSAKTSQSMVATCYSKFAWLHHGQPRAATAEFARTEMRWSGISAVTNNLIRSDLVRVRPPAARSSVLLAEDFGTKAHRGVDDAQLSKAAFTLTTNRTSA
jgi:hypothetical protein